MSETLYRKYRPKNFSEIIGQVHIVQTLTNAVKKNRVGQAYLFTGPRGTGKTSIARILARTVNCDNLKNAITCEKCEACRLISENKTLDIIEIDAASNTGVDNIRELRETVALPPTILKYKIYIIDEVHMLSGGAFNALLKTLEEPPAHVIFILATTEIHKVPQTIISRCQRFDFVRLPIKNIVEKLSLIAKSEKIKIDADSLEMIAISAEGSFRDAESLLEQIIAFEDKEITVGKVEEILGTTDKKSASELAEMITEKNASDAIEKINTLMNDGYDLAIFNKSLINYFRQLMLLKINEKLSGFFTYEMTGEQIENMKKLAHKAELADIISTINLLLEAQGKISSFMLPQLPLEIAVIKATRTFPQESIKYKVESIKQEKENESELSSKFKTHPPAGEAGSSKPQLAVPTGKQENQNDAETNYKSAPAEENDTTIKQSNNLTIESVKANWPKLLSEIKPFNHSLNALLSNCKVVEIKNNQISIATPYEFYRERLDEKANKLTIEKIFSNILGSKILVSIITDKNIAIKKLPAANDDKAGKENTQDPLLADALEIMGGKIVEE
jgi:DNA polymerase III subunit gamma/tau